MARMDGDQRRAQIRDVAAELFDQYGYADTTLEQIARKVGIRKASLYYHFTSKSQLLVEIHEEMIELILAAQRERLARTDQDEAGMLLGMMTDLVALMESHPGHLRIFFEHFRELPAETRQAVSLQRDQYRQSLVRLIEQGIAVGSFREADPQLAAFAVLGMCNWTYQWFSTTGRLPAAEIAHAFWDLVTRGLLAGPTP
jgi:AcrR family transcriptional regulator